MLFAVLKEPIQGSVYASDTNVRLIDFYIAIQKHLPEFLEEVYTIYRTYKQIPLGRGGRPQTFRDANRSSESYIQWIRLNYLNYSRNDTSVYISAVSYFLNRASYLTHEFIDEAALREASRLIQPVQFSYQSLNTSLIIVQPDDFVYVNVPPLCDAEFNELADRVKQLRSFVLVCDTTPAALAAFPSATRLSNGQLIVVKR
jgi:site-specific DNA-adenine methylase